MNKQPPKVTVVVPCYNAENYLIKCLDSLVFQSYTNLEVIMIEDCSTDNTNKILQSYVKKYSNFIAIYNKKSGGLGNARNVGLDASSGEYITFLDSDDWVPENYIAELYRSLLKSKVDVAVCDMYLRYDDPAKGQRVIVYDKKPSKYGLINSGLAASSNNKLFNRKCFKSLRYPKGIVNEDIPVTLAILSKFKSTYTKDTYYNYYQRPGSIQNGNITNKRFDIFNAVVLLKENLGNEVDKKMWDAVIWHQIIAVFLYVIPKAKGIRYRSKLIKEFSKLIGVHAIDIKNNNGLKEFMGERKINKVYGLIAINSLKNNNYLVCSFSMELFKLVNENKLVSLVIVSIRHPRRSLIKIYVKMTIKIRRKSVIKIDPTLDDLIFAAKRQNSINSDYSVSVVIPNYNYQRYLLQRVFSILHQTAKINEIIIMDDNSADNSVELSRKIKKEINSYVNIRLINNKVNKGTFRQWERGFLEAESKYVWIAEADDYSDKRFIEAAIKPMRRNNKVLMSYVNTGYMNEDGWLLGDVKNDIDYLKSGHWNKSFVSDGYNEAQAYFYLNNTIANVSSVIFRKKSDINYSSLFSSACKYKQAGDWVFYVNYMVYGDIAYTNKIYNYYRLHGNNVSTTTKAQDHIDEINEIQKYFISKLKLNAEQQKRMSERVSLLKKSWNI